MAQRKQTSILTALAAMSRLLVYILTLIDLVSSNAYGQLPPRSTNPSASLRHLLPTSNGLFLTAVNQNRVDTVLHYRPDTKAINDVQTRSFGTVFENVEELFAWNDVLYFVPASGANRHELWRSDGTISGTWLVKDINPNGPSSPKHFQPFNDLLYFVADDGIHGFELWRTDGTQEGTQLFIDIHAPEVHIGTTNPITPFYDVALFRAAPTADLGELWRSDGTPEGTISIPVENIDLAAFEGSIVALSDSAVFVAQTPEAGMELWRTDGTERGTRLVLDIFPGPVGSDPSNLTPYGNGVIFKAQSDEFGTELWVSDGTHSGTKLVCDIAPGAQSSDPAPFCVSGDLVYFVANHPDSGRELWVSDGTASGTVLIQDLEPGIASSNPYQITAFKNGVAFSALHSPIGEELWFSDGQAAGTRLIKDINIGKSSSEPYHLTVLDDVLYFAADDGRYGEELWRSDGTNNGTYLELDLNPATTRWEGLTPTAWASLDDTIYFVSDGKGSPPGLWKSDGSSAGTSLHCPLPESIGPTQVERIIPTTSAIYLVQASTDGGLHLYYCSNSAPASPLSLLMPSDDLRISLRSSSDMSPYNDELYFAALSEDSGDELWKVSPFSPTPVLVADIAPGRASSSPRSFTVVPGKLFFVATDPAHGEELRVLANDSVQLVSDIYPGKESARPNRLTVANEDLYFVANGGKFGPEIWKTAISTNETYRLTDVNPIQSADALPPMELTASNGILFFTADDGVSGRELWRVARDTNEVYQIRDIFSGRASSNPEALTMLDGRLFFRAESRDHGIELFTSDGTENGTYLLKDLAVGPSSSTPTHLTEYRGLLVFFAHAGHEAKYQSHARFWLTDGHKFETPGHDTTQLIDIIRTEASLYFQCNWSPFGVELWSAQLADGENSLGFEFISSNLQDEAYATD